VQTCRDGFAIRGLTLAIEPVKVHNAGDLGLHCRKPDEPVELS
jgi:hypothetical protein